MRHLDFTPLFRSTVGFDRLVGMLDAANGFDADSYPPYNIERTGDNAYRITMAVAGFGGTELKIDIKETLLTVRGDKTPEASERTYLHRGIANRAFERRFQLADHVEVTGASLTNGVLSVDLVRNLPEKLKPRSIEITVDGAPKQIAAETATSKAA
jgi:molecular chaperone IbpA